jgi:hypothetical protein
MKPGEDRRQARTVLPFVAVSAGAIPAALARLQLGSTWSDSEYARAALEELPLCAGERN